jgi:exopolysaccharide biosynthesis polyprenyl glycosylphosphotransferase
MIRRKHQTMAAVYVAVDSLASVLAMLAAYYLRFAAEVIPLTKGTQQLAVYAHILPLVAVVFPLSFFIQGLYGRGPSRSEEWVGVGIGTLLGSVVLSGLLLWIRPGDPEAFYSRATLAIFALCEVALVLFGRSLLRSVVERRHREGKDLDRVIIAGNGDLARAVAERIAAHQEIGVRIVGYLEHDQKEGEIVSIPRLGTIDEVSEALRDHAVSHVYVAMPQTSGAAIMQLLDRLMRDCASIHVVPDLLQFMVLRSRVEDIDGLPTINLSDTPIEGWGRLVKRCFDVCMAAAAILVLSPLLLLMALLIFLEDRGPVFYRQVRMGLDGTPFEILKFRSMKQNAETATGAVWADRDDPRRTRIGAFLRAWSLDEMPQLWNVLKGEMSIVGPRPERPHFVEQFRAEFPHYMLRHKVRAGMTGWAQVHGWRGNTSVRKRIEHDLYYIENWSLMLDLKIVLMTLRHGLRNENAY